MFFFCDIFVLNEINPIILILSRQIVLFIILEFNINIKNKYYYACIILVLQMKKYTILLYLVILVNTG